MGEVDFDRVNSLAQELAGKGVDEYEMAKVMAFLRDVQDLGKLRELLSRFSRSKDFGRSKKTKGYFREIGRAFENYSTGDVERDQEFFSWVRRLIKYHRLQGIPSPSYTGRVKFFNSSRDFGFIVRDDGQGEVFVHLSGIREKGRTLASDDRVRFKIVKGKRGDQASEVEIIE